ncbi:MAG: DHH family phosphoesterase [Candidatus Omnitrophica bacterium]|nr:DHH family phosphoesterase [Candidatus Omnitrophota bacterium]
MLARSAWTLHPADPARASALADRVEAAPLIGQLLLNRGLREATEAARFLNPSLSNLQDPLALPDMPRAIARLRRAVNARETIVIFGDSDVDGVTASAIVSETLTSLGARVSVALANRLSDGYGFPTRLIARLGRLGASLAVLVDCGTNQREEIRELARQGIETIVLDHHVPMEDLAAPAALVNPHCGDGAGRGLCSAGLAVKLVQALYPDDAERLGRVMDLAALGTLADCAPLVGDNRIIVSEGLPRVLNTVRPGLRRLCEAVGVTQPSPDQLVQRLVPRLNAAGRLGDARPVLRLLVEDREREVERLAHVLTEAHQVTKTLSRQILVEAMEQAGRISCKDELVMVVGRRGWHPGLMGPVASQLMERYGRPAIAIALGDRTGTGSGRAPALFNLVEALGACQRSVLAYGGHAQACGLTIQATGLERLREEVNRHAERAGSRRSLGHTRVIDVEARLAHVTLPVAQVIDRFKPFGSGNPKPTVLISKVQLESDEDGRGWLTDQTARRRLRGRLAGLRSQERYDVVVSSVTLEREVALSLCDARLATWQPVA